MSQPISTVVPSLDGSVLSVLARTAQPLTGRKIHQLAASGSESGTRKVLRRLTSTGLVTATEVGASVQYALNRQHLAANVVLELTELRQRLFERMRDAIEQWSPKPVHASVFGSTARGDGDLHSDVDLLLVHEFADDPPPDWDELGEQVYAWSGNHLQTYELTEAELADHLHVGEPIVKDWVRDAVTIYGPDFLDLRNRIAHEVIPR
ncbi:nucleotidyltransferase domain-containing protein [Kribbella pittospori]|uniref:Nucleotidyltransferase domain-containing protein n=1 Tax=Kribbella pittospori TaxID=722689 RepID=A0A4V2M9P5_9ACTN|nr:nucleotidyltransferase domain-containing protein [Kribbella pittospori]TCC56152.1 nucleotidyltransferase domain-containing protein [Kribbella pittospori]